MSEDWEVAPNKEREPTVDRPKKALTPNALVSGSESSGDSSMERLLQEVRAFVVRSDPGATEAVAQPQHHQHTQPEPSLVETSSGTAPRDPTEKALLRIKKDPAFRRTKNAGYWDRHKALKGLCHKCRQPGHKFLHCPLWDKNRHPTEGK